MPGRSVPVVLTVAALTCGAIVSTAMSVAHAAPAAAKWKVVATPDVGAHTRLTSVSCPDATTCFAVGYIDHGDTWSSVIARWDGKRWTRAVHPRLGQDQLWGVTCVSTTQCTAVGEYYNPIGVSTLVEVWDGTRWAVEPSSNPSVFGNVLRSVSCSEDNRCVAVGHLSDMHGYLLPIALSGGGLGGWNGTILPYSGFVDDNSLASVSCPTTTRCLAVGTTNEQESRPEVRVLVDQWNGKKWSNAPVVQPDSADRSLSSITCSTLARCVAVGRVGDRALVERRTPTGWSTEPSADVGAATGALSGVACLPSGQCVAVGTAGDDTAHAHTLIETRNGSTWTRTSAPAVGDDDAIVSVACATSTVCFAVGSTRTGTTTSPLVLTGVI